jgi:hypothetical protein
MPTIMKRIFDKPKPQEFHTFDHWRACQRSQGDPTRWHPVQAVCVAAGALSLLTLATVVFLQIMAAAGSEMPPVSFLIRLDQVMYLSAASFFACVVVLLTFNHFRTR